MAVHVPISLEAQMEARTLMLSSNNVLHTAHGEPVIVPSQDIVLGLYYATRQRVNARGEGSFFSNIAEVSRAYESGGVELHAAITVRIKESEKNDDGTFTEVVKRHETTVGRALLSEILPAGLPFLVPLLAAMIAGMIWGAIPGVLKIRVGTNEVISTLLLSFIAVWLLYWCVQSPALLRKPMTSSATLPESLEIPDSTKLPLLTGDYSFPVNIGLPATIIIAIVAGVLLSKTLLGVQLRAVGFNPVAASRAGISYARMVVLALGIAGALGGLAGGFMLLGDQYLLKDGFSSGYGFDGLVAGLLARGSVVGVIAAALLFGFLRSGGINMEMVAGVPTALVMVIQGLIVVTLAGAAYFIGRRS